MKKYTFDASKPNMEYLELRKAEKLPYAAVVNMALDVYRNHMTKRKGKECEPLVCPKCKSPYWNTPRKKQ